MKTPFNFSEDFYRFAMVFVVAVAWIAFQHYDYERRIEEAPYEACRSLPTEEVMADCIVGVSREP